MEKGVGLEKVFKTSFYPLMVYSQSDFRQNLFFYCDLFVFVLVLFC